MKNIKHVNPITVWWIVTIISIIILAIAQIAGVNVD